MKALVRGVAMVGASFFGVVSGIALFAGDFNVAFTGGLLTASLIWLYRKLKPKKVIVYKGPKTVHRFGVEER